MKYDVNLSEGGSLISLPKERTLEILADASEAELKVLIAIACGESEEEAKKLSGVIEAEFNSALAYLRGAKLITKASKRKKAADTEEKTDRKVNSKDTRTAEIDLAHDNTLPEYSSDEIARLTSSDRVLSSMLDEAQQVFGKVFNQVEMNYILAMRDHLGLDGEYILMLLQYFRAENKPLCYAARVAHELVKKGISEPESLEAYIRRRDTFKGMEGKYRDLFGIGARALTTYEEKYFTSWGTELKLPFELVRLAFDRTVEKKGKPEKFYMNGILTKWHALGLKTEDEVSAYESESKNKKASAQKGEGSFDVNDFFNAALERTYGKKE